MSVKTLPEKKPTPIVTAKAVNYTPWLLLLLAVVAGFIAADVISQGGGFLFGEADMFLVDHNDPDRAFISKILSPHSHDASHYQARELSHFFETFDARFIYWCATHNHPHFYSLMNFVFLVLLSLAHWHYTTKYFRMDPLVSILLIGLFWTTPSIFFSGIYVRVAKQGAALMLFLLAWHIIRNTAFMNVGRRFFQPESRNFKTALWVQTFLMSLALCWFDRQGYFLLGTFILSVVAFWLGPKVPNRAILITAMVAGLLAHTVYGRYIGPELIRKYTGFEVSFEYQSLPWKQFFDRFFTYIWEGTALLANDFRYYFANLTGGLTLFVWAGMAWLFARTQSRLEAPGAAANSGPRLKGFFGLLFIGWLILLIVMNAAMVLRHEPLIWPDVRTHYYWIPTTALVLLAVTLASQALLTRYRLSVWIPRLALAAFLISNISALPEHYRIARSGHLQGYIAAAPILLKAMKELNNTPEGAPNGQKFDAKKLAHIEGDFNAILKNPLGTPNMTAQDFIFSSHFYNFLRSQRNLDFRQPGQP